MRIILTEEEKQIISDINCRCGNASHLDYIYLLKLALGFKKQNYNWKKIESKIEETFANYPKQS